MRAVVRSTVQLPRVLLVAYLLTQARAALRAGRVFRAQEFVDEACDEAGKIAWEGPPLYPEQALAIAVTDLASCRAWRAIELVSRRGLQHCRDLGIDHLAGKPRTHSMVVPCAPF